MKVNARMVKRRARMLVNIIKERARGVDFSMIKATDAHYPKNKAAHYYPYLMTIEDTLKNGLKRIPFEPSEKAFIDVGCGKGICLKAACEYGYGRVAGIEFLHELAETAKKNMRVLQLPATVYEGNAITFDRYADYDVYYFYNPFDATVFKPVIAAIDASLQDRPRTIYVIYTSPTSHELWIEAGFNFVDKYVDENRGTQVNIYEKTL